MKTKPKLKPRRMWANYYADHSVCPHGSLKEALQHGALFGAAHKAVFVAVIPLDDVDALVAKAYDGSRMELDGTFAQLRAALAAIGVLPKARAKKGGWK